MTSSFRFYWAGSVTVAGTTYEVGSLVQPVQEVSLPGTYPQPKVIPFTCPAGSTITLWAYSATDPDWTCAVIVANGGQCFDIEAKGDKPTSTTDKTPLGTYINYNTQHVDPEAPGIFPSQHMRVGLSATARSSSTLASATGGFIYQINVRNNDDAGTGVPVSGVLYLWN